MEGHDEEFGITELEAGVADGSIHDRTNVYSSDAGETFVQNFMGFCIKHHGFCIKNHGFCTKHHRFCTEPA